MIDSETISKKELKFVRTTAVNKLLKLRKRVRIVPGSTSAGKTIGILSILIDKCIKIPNLEVSVVAESIPHLKKGALKDFLKLMKITNRYDKACYNKTERVYTFPNGSYMEFFGVLDDPDKLRGPRRDILYMNEASSLPWESYQQASIRTNMEIWLDFNPSHEFWAHEELSDDVDVEWLTLVFSDNEALEPALIRELEKNKVKGFYNSDLPVEELFDKTNIKNAYWANWWKVYGLGMLGALEGVIFTNWKQIKEIPPYAKYLGTGIDFGYTNDPTTIIDYYRADGIVIWDERTYMTGLKNSQIARLLKAQGKSRKTRIVADSAEPKSIDEINDYGFNVQPAEKGRDSINFGIDIIQQEPFMVTSRSTNLITELRKYSWDQDKNGKYLNVPIDAFNHGIDPGRYFYTRWISNKNKVDETAAKRALEKALQYFN